ncbi:MAG: hypothetical protein K1X94_16070 [Sandaracinaceae bacterium]|nr:hypothetical protein [Sandaracinaceae bacterium]
MSETSSSTNPWLLGCGIAAGIGLVLGCCGFGIFTFACGGLVSVGQESQLQLISASLHAETPGHPRAAEYDAELVRFDAVRPSIGFLTFGTLNNRFEDSRADGTIDDAELDHLMELVRDIDDHGGNVDMNQYPEGR